MADNTSPEQIKQWKEASEQFMADKKAESEAEKHRQELAMHIKGESLAAAAKARVKVKASREFMRAGGNATDFEKVWERMYDDIVYQTALKSLVQGPANSGKHRL